MTRPEKAKQKKKEERRYGSRVKPAQTGQNKEGAGSHAKIKLACACMLKLGCTKGKSHVA